LNRYVALVTNRYPVDPNDVASPFVRDFCLALQARGVDVRVITPYYPTGRPERDAWVERFRWADSERVLSQLSCYNPRDLLNIGKAVWAGHRATQAMVSTFRPDCILALWALPSGWWARTAARKLGIPYGVWCLGTDIQVWGRRPGARRLIHNILRRAAHVYADGFALASETQTLAGRACDFMPSFRQLGNGGKTRPDHPQNGERYYLFVGRLSRAKGVLDLLAAARLLGSPTDFKIVLAGFADPGLDVQREIQRHGVEDTCRFVGALLPERLFAYLRYAHAVVIPSHRDSIPLVLGEALQAGKPVLCADLPDLCVLLHRYRVGSVFQAGDAQSLANNLKSFKIPRNLTAEIARFLADFSPAAAAERFCADFFPDAVAGDPPPPVRKEAVHA
jgi:glycosyltransferase involved in cell wall biosynthesis